MGRIDLPYVETIPANGKLYYYYRRGKLRRRLPGAPGEPGFTAAYDAFHSAATTADENRPDSTNGEGTLAALVAAYRASPEWRALQPATHSDYQKALKPLETRFGHLVVKAIPRAFVFGLRDLYATRPAKKPNDPPIATPRRANRMVAVLSIILSWGVDRGWRPDNPALRPKKLKTGEGWRPWTAAELATFEACDKVSAELKLAVVLAAASGQRGGDLITMTWGAYRDGAIEVVQLKTEARVWVPLHATAKARVDAAPRRAVTILTRPDGQPWKINHFRHAMGDAIRAAGLIGVVTHGLRATAATWLAEAGCSEREIMAITGHTSSSSVARYTRQAEQKVRATAAVEKLEKHRRSKTSST
jgi:integrase